MTSFLGAPIRFEGRVYGNLYLTDKVGASEFSADDEAVIEALAVAAGIALENARLNRRARRGRRLRGRERMARDLHDTVIQRLFAIGLSLQGLTSTPGGQALGGRLDATIVEIDETIHQIRATIFELGGSGGRGIRPRVLELAREMGPVVGFDVPVEFLGAVDTWVSPGVAEQLLPTLREALTNVARHAAATRVRVRLSVIGRMLRLEVTDNGRGFVGASLPGGGLGLPNMRRRAEVLGGQLRVTHPATGGTAVIWEVPMVVEADGAPAGDDGAPRSTGPTALLDAPDPA